MASVNKVILLGNLGRDPELKYTQSGMAIVNLSVATTSSGGRDREQVTEWHRVIVFDKQAESCGQYLAKGRQVYIEGRIQTRSWDDQQTGQKKTMVEIVANQVVFIGGNQEGGGQGGGRSGGGGGGQGNGGRSGGGGNGGRGDGDRSQGGGGRGGNSGGGGWGGGGNGGGRGAANVSGDWDEESAGAGAGGGFDDDEIPF